ncbi:hypothetical protein EYF80_042169 [Liparis tanakae]|uniref:Uncharacterized protein n=1 Tax=Liparis tanakae TaxID=230148 RepID=A0A4Z2G267_9TELE|nr:hypothetical protein EYF80_042169 [Liparis tanakae]
MGSPILGPGGPVFAHATEVRGWEGFRPGPEPLTPPLEFKGSAAKEKRERDPQHRLVIEHQGPALPLHTILPLLLLLLLLLLLSIDNRDPKVQRSEGFSSVLKLPVES